MSPPLLRLDRVGPHVTITLDDPRRQNALSLEMVAEIDHALEDSLGASSLTIAGASDVGSGTVNSGASSGGGSTSGSGTGSTSSGTGSTSSGSGTGTTTGCGRGGAGSARIAGRRTKSSRSVSSVLGVYSAAAG